MNRAEQYFEQIEQYLRGEMPPPVRAAFEAEMAADPELAVWVQQHRLERQGLEWLVERDLLAKMQAWDREAALQQPVASPRRGVIRPMAMLWRVAAVLALAVFGWWLLRQNKFSVEDAAPPVVQTQPKPSTKSPAFRRPRPAKPSPAKPIPQKEEAPETGIAQQTPSETPGQTLAPVEELETPGAPDYAALANEFYHERDFIPPAGSKGISSNQYGQALDDYRNGKFSDVVTKLQPAQNTGPDPLQRKELLAHSFYKNGQYEAAIPYFREIISSGKQPYAQRAEWAMALTLVQLMPAKKPLLDRVLSGILANPHHAYYTQAKALKARLAE